MPEGCPRGGNVQGLDKQDDLGYTQGKGEKFMRHRVLTRRYRDWPGEIRRVLIGLTLKPASGLGDMACHQNCKTFVAFREDGKIVGWAGANKSGDFMVYVRRSYRKRGIGSLLHRHAKKWHGKEMYIYPEPSNQGFFESLGYEV